MTKLNILFLFTLLFSQLAFAVPTRIYVTGDGRQSSYCNANSGYFCLDNIKRQAQADAERDARWSCEMSHRGRALTFTASTNTNCNPSYLPPNHNGTWVNCSAQCRMQCEVEQ